MKCLLIYQPLRQKYVTVIMPPLVAGTQLHARTLRALRDLATKMNRMAIMPAVTCDGQCSIDTACSDWAVPRAVVHGYVYETEPIADAQLLSIEDIQYAAATMVIVHISDQHFSRNTVPFDKKLKEEILEPSRMPTTNEFNWTRLFLRTTQFAQ